MNVSEDILSNTTVLIPLISLALNLGLIGLVIYLLKKGSHFNGDKTPDEKIAAVYKEAEYKSAELMKEATIRAKHIVEEAGLTKSTLENRLEKELGQMTDSLNQKIQANESQIYEQFKKVFDTVSQSYQAEGAQLSNNFKEEGETVLKTFIQTVHAEINSVREQIFGKIDSKINIIEEDLEKYRDAEYQKIDQNIKKIAKNTLETFLKDVLTLENHEQVLLKSLDKFKKENPITVSK